MPLSPSAPHPYTARSCPVRIRLTRTFHSSFWRTTVFSASPMRMWSPSMTTSGQAVQEAQRDCDPLHGVSPPFASMCRRAAGWRAASARRELRMWRAAGASASSAAAFCCKSVRTWMHGPIPSERHDVRDLGERQPEPTLLPHEREQTQYVVRVEAIAGRCTPWLRRMPRASYKRRALRLIPLLADTSPTRSITL